jgi:hypothetical protein
MIEKIRSHIGHYIVLLLILGLGFVMAVLASPNKQLQLVAMVMTTFFYIAWGILHHLINHDLTAKIVIEYVLIGSFGLSAVFFILKGGLL